MAQTWELTLFTATSVQGVGNTSSASGDNGVGIHAEWALTLNTGQVYAIGAGNTSSTGVGSATASNLVWYEIDVVVGSSGYGNTLSESWGNATPVGPPAASGSGNTLSSSVGNVGRYGGYLMGMTDGFFADFDTSGDLLLPDTTGEFTLTVPVPA